MKDKNNHAEFDALINACLDGHLSEEEADLLSQRIEESSEIRQRYWELASVHGMIEQSMQNVSLKAVTGEGVVTPIRPKGYSRWPRIGAVAAGIVIGILSTTAVFGFVAPRMAEIRPQLISVMRDAFEDPTQTFQRGIARHANEWFFHGKVEVVKSENPEPVSGEHILRISPSPERKKGQVHYLIDLNDYPEVLASERRSIQVGCHFFTTGEDGGNYAIRIGAFAETPEEVGAIWSDPSEIEERSLQQISRQNLKNKEHVGWQGLTTDMSLPKGTRTVIVGIWASQGRDNPNVGNRYLDAMSMQFVLDSLDVIPTVSE